MRTFPFTLVQLSMEITIYLIPESSAFYHKYDYQKMRTLPFPLVQSGNVQGNWLSI